MVWLFLTIAAGSPLTASGAQAQTITISDPKEFNAYASSSQLKDPENQAQALRAFLKLYPNSSARAAALDQLLDNDMKAGRQVEALGDTNSLLSIDPSNLKSLFIAFSIYQKMADSEPDAGKADEFRVKASQMAQRGLDAPTPKGLTDVALTPIRNQFRSAIDGVATTLGGAPAITGEAPWRPRIAEDNKAATLEDTTAFISNTLQYKGRGTGVPATARQCALSLEHTASSAQETIDLKDLDPLSISVTGRTVSISGSNNGPYGSVCPKSGVSCTEANADKLVADTHLWLDSPETAKRLARALMHAALLCGGPRAVSPF